PGPLAEGPRPGQPPRQGRPGEAASGGTCGVRETVVRRGGALEEGGNAREGGGQEMNDHHAGLSEAKARAREEVKRRLALPLAALVLLAFVANGPGNAARAALLRGVETKPDEEEKDRELIKALEEARLAQAETVAGSNRFAIERAVPRFREAFRAYG